MTRGSTGLYISRFSAVINVCYSSNNSSAMILKNAGSADVRTLEMIEETRATGGVSVK
jgi:hypothetical protein